MLKIYNASYFYGDIKLVDHIDFHVGRFDTDYLGNGYGYVKSATNNVNRANFELTKMDAFLEYLSNVDVNDGWVQDFKLWNPQSYETLEKKMQGIEKTEENYERFGLNEEAVLFFMEGLMLSNYDEKLVKRYFGRRPLTGMYILQPGARFSLATGPFDEDREDYEVFQSESLGKQLVLTKLDRKIF